MLSYFTDLQGSQTDSTSIYARSLLSYFTDLQGSQTRRDKRSTSNGLVTLLIYKVLKQTPSAFARETCLVTLLIYKVLKPPSSFLRYIGGLVTLLIYKVLKQSLR